mgnify:CR=1 FL=1
MPVPPPKILPRRKAPLLSMPEQHTMPSYTAGGHAGDPRHDPERGKSASGSDGSAKDGVVTRRAGKRREWDGSPTIGLFNNHRDTFSSRYHLTRRGKVKRLGQIMRIANQFDVVRGLTPVKMRLMLEALGPHSSRSGRYCPCGRRFCRSRSATSSRSCAPMPTRCRIRSSSTR